MTETNSTLRCPTCDDNNRCGDPWHGQSYTPDELNAQMAGMREACAKLGADYLNAYINDDLDECSSLELAEAIRSLNNSAADAGREVIRQPLLDRIAELEREKAELAGKLTGLLNTLPPIIRHAEFSMEHSFNSPSSHQEFIRQDGEDMREFRAALKKAKGE